VSPQVKCVRNDKNSYDEQCLQLLADIFPLHYASSQYFYAQLEHRNANSTSIYNSVNEFLEALTTERNKVPSTTHKQEKPSGGWEF